MDTSLNKKKTKKTKHNKPNLMSTNKCPLKTESAKETLPWGVTAQGINALYKLHSRGMIVCKQKTKDKELDSMLVTDVLTCFVGLLDF